MSERIKRVNELIKESLGKIIEEGFRIDNCLVTISSVKTSPDLRQAQVFVSIFPYEKKEQADKFFKQNLSRIQEDFGNSIELKYTPKIEIIFDESFEYGAKIDSLFDKIKRDKIDR